MEAAAAFTVAECWGVEAAAAFVPNDCFGPDTWASRVYEAETHLLGLGDRVVRALVPPVARGDYRGCA